MQADAIDGGDVVLKVREELAKRGIELVVVHMPMRTELFTDISHDHAKPLDRLHQDSRTAQRQNLRLRLSGVRTINLYQQLRDASLREDIYKENRFHIKDEPAHQIGLELGRELRTQGVIRGKSGPKSVVFVGDCFANSFADAIQRTNDYDRIRSLIKYGGGNQAHNHLFAFEDEYLNDTDIIVWVMRDRDLGDNGAAPLCLAHNDEALESSVVEARIVKTTLLNADFVSRMPYPNATRATLFERVDTGEQFVGVDYIARNRQLQISRLFKENYRVKLSLLPLTAFEKVNRKAASEFLIDDLNDLKSSRYWIEGWLDLRSPEVVQVRLEDVSS
ncbi:MAG: hypothetical protein AAF585_08390 [Verrucomicrobiota bacterium]